MKSFICVLLVASITWTVDVSAQTIKTIAGGNGDGIPALKAGLMLPAGLATDAENNLYFVEPSRNQVRMVERATGRIFHVAGTGERGYGGDGELAVDAKLAVPADIAIDGFGNLFIADAYNSIIRKVDLETGIITTVAGSPGVSGDRGDGGLAINARLAGPEGIAVDNQGNLIISEFYNDKIKRVDMHTGIINTIAGTGIPGFSGDGGPALNAQLNDPYGVAVDSEGNIYIADQQNNRIRKIDAEGNISTFAGTGIPANTGDSNLANQAAIYRPTAVYVDSEDNIYFNSGNVVRQVNATDHVISTYAGNGLQGFSGDGGPATSARFNRPARIAGDSYGNIFVSDQLNERIRVVNISGIINTYAGNGTRIDEIEGAPAESIRLNDPGKIARDAAGNLFIVTGDRMIYKVHAESGIVEHYAGTGEFGYSGDNTPAVNAKFRGPLSIDADIEGNLYISDYSNHRIFIVSAGDGLLRTIAGTGVSGFDGDDGAATDAELNSPYDVEIADNSDIFIVDHGNNRIRKIDHATGVITTVAGSGTTGSAADGNLATKTKLLYPTAMDVDHFGNIFIVFHNRIRKVDHLTQIVETIAGSDRRGYSGDGGPATLAQLEYPRDVDVDKYGNIYIADAGNHAIRRVDSDTRIITTIAGNGEPGYYGEDVPAVSALLNSPQDVLISDSGDELLISDRSNGRIREIDGLTESDQVREYIELEGSYLSRKGSYRPLTWLQGRVQFSFEFYYNSKAMKPVGTGFIRLPKADMYFRKSTLETLEFQGQRTILTGRGTVNMEGNYSFMLDYKDGFRDWVRIIIWNEAGQIFYDSQYGDEIGTYPNSLVGDFDDWYTNEGLPGTSIDELIGDFSSDPAGPSLYPNPSGDSGFSYRFNSEMGGPVTIRIFDLRGIEVYQFNADVIKGINYIRLTPKLNKGNYLMRVFGSDLILQERLVIE